MTFQYLLSPSKDFILLFHAWLCLNFGVFIRNNVVLSRITQMVCLVQKHSYTACCKKDGVLLRCSIITCTILIVDCPSDFKGS